LEKNRDKSRIKRLCGLADSFTGNSCSIHAISSIYYLRTIRLSCGRYDLKRSELFALFAYETGYVRRCLYFMLSLSRNLQNLRNYVINIDESERSHLRAIIGESVNVRRIDVPHAGRVVRKVIKS